MGDENDYVELPLEMYDMIVSYLGPKELYNVYVQTYPSHISGDIFERTKNNKFLKDPEDKLKILN